MTTKRNQIHNPPKKEKIVDKQGNARCRIFCKSGTATLLIAKGLTRPAADIMIKSITNNCDKLGGEVACEFIITPKR